MVYFPWDIDRVYWEVMVDDHGRLLRNAIDWALDEERPVTVTGPGVLDVTRLEAEELDDRPPGESHESDDDAAEFPRDDSVAAAAGPAAAARGQARVSKVQFLVAGGTPAVQTSSGVMTPDGAIHSRSRSDRGRFLVMGVPGGLKNLYQPVGQSAFGVTGLPVSRR